MPLSSHMRSAVENISIHASRPKESSCCTIHNIKELKILRVFLDPWHKLKPIHLSVFCSMVVAWWVDRRLSGENSPTIFQFVCSNCSPVTTVLRILHTLCPLWMWLLSFKSLQYCHLAAFFAISPATPLSKAFPGLTLQRAWEAHCILLLGETTF